MGWPCRRVSSGVLKPARTIAFGERQRVCGGQRLSASRASWCRWQDSGKPVAAVACQRELGCLGEGCTRDSLAGTGAVGPVIGPLVQALAHGLGCTHEPGRMCWFSAGPAFRVAGRRPIVVCSFLWPRSGGGRADGAPDQHRFGGRPGWAGLGAGGSGLGGGLLLGPAEGRRLRRLRRGADTAHRRPGTGPSARWPVRRDPARVPALAPSAGL